MAASTIKIHIASGFDPTGVREASAALDKLGQNLRTSNAELSRAIHDRASAVATDYAAAADKGVAHSVLSAREIEAAWTRAMEKVPAEATKGFGAMANVAKGAAKGLGGVFSGIAESLFSGGAWQAGSMLLVKGFKLAFDALQAHAKKAWEQVRHTSEESARQIADDIKAVNDSMREQLAVIDRIAARRKDELAAVQALTKAEIELAKQQAIASGMDPAAASAAAADLAATVDEETEAARLNALIDERQKKIEAAGKAEVAAQKAVSDAIAAKAAADEEYQKRRDKFINANNMDHVFQGTTYGGVWLDVRDNSAERRAKEGAAFDRSEAAAKLRKDLKMDDFDREIADAQKSAAEARNTLEESAAAVKNAQVALDALDAKRKARELAAQSEVASQVEEEARKREEAAEKAAEAAKKADDEELKARQKAEDELHRERLANIKAEADASKAAQSEAQRSAAAARSEFDRAFAMYRSEDKGAARIAEERDYAADYRQLRKDAASYGGKWRIDELASLMAAGDAAAEAETLERWRRSASFTPEVESMVRAAAADQTRTTAEDELRKISENTKGLADKLDELLSVK